MNETLKVLTLGLLETVRKWLAPVGNVWLSDIGIPSHESHREHHQYYLKVILADNVCHYFPTTLL